MTDRPHKATQPQSIPRATAMARIDQLIAMKQKAKKHCTIPIEVRINERGEIVAVETIPPKVRLA